MVPSHRRFAFVVGAATAVLWQSHAAAVITQVDGTVLPLTNRMQTALDRPVAQGGEGTAGLVHAVFDANVVPEVFRIPTEPNGDFRTVTFHDIEEGAGYENTIGWYNVSDPTTLYPVLTCTPTNHEPGAVVDVDFQAEYAAGRYDGGFVGFFLVSPGSDGGCGNPANLGQPGSTAFIVYTEAQLNGDGNYVHYLIYQSKENPLAYYFGFEDLWRGGDNDFEDMAVKVIGLVTACEPTQEICDGLDNNCDGLIDNNPVDVGQDCTEIAGNNPGVGPCEAGILECASTGPGDTTKTCVGEVGPGDEVCNNFDDDCDGTIDNDPSDPSLGQACGPTDEGSCELGSNECIAGTIACVGVVGPSPELCDGIDSDCDGVIDGTVPEPATGCTTDADCDANAPFCLPSAVTGGLVCARGPIDVVGQCTIAGSTCTGVKRCESGAVVCVETDPGTPEICNGGDDNCNGYIDEGDPGGGAECGPGGITLEQANTGQCEPGIEHCLGGSIQCIGGRGPAPEICDGLDNDCDGEADQLAECPGENKCVEGRCVEPCGSGEFPCPAGHTCVEGYCIPNSGGTGGSAGAAGSAGSAGAAGTAGGAGFGGSGGSSAQGGSAGMSGSGGASPDGGTAASSGGPEAPPPRENWGLATGGGGASCALGNSKASLPAALFALLALVLGTRISMRRRERGAK
ncbi:MAG: DUF4114 domain-containing protein [Myxococcota bacterium]